MSYKIAFIVFICSAIAEIARQFGQIGASACVGQILSTV